MDGEITILPSLGGTRWAANDINDFGDIVGSSRTPDNDLHATLWSEGAIFDLNDLLEPGFEGILHSAKSINDFGQIVAYGNVDSDFQYEGFLLTPVPEPGGAAVTLLLGAILFRRPRRP